MDSDLSHFTVGIAGLGLMGGSLALALHGHCQSLLGFDPDPAVVALSMERSVVDRASTHPGDLLPDVDLVILAAPVSAILALLGELPDLHPGQAVVIDLGSTKHLVCQAMQALPDRFEPLGGHPMCGKEVNGLLNADRALFLGASFALTPLPNTTSRARVVAQQLVRAIGAKPLWIDPRTHDRWTAATSHFPYLLSNALAALTPLEAAPLVGPGWRSTARLASSSPRVMSDILETNRENVLVELDRFRRRLDQLEAALQAEDRTGLLELLQSGAERQQDISRTDRSEDNL